MAAGREIKKKIASVQTTQKSTRAMQMVAASRMRRTQERMQQGRPYSRRIEEMIGHLANANPEYRHGYMVTREVKRTGYIVVSTDRGLCGGLNVNLFRELIRRVKEWQAAGVETELALVGNKAAQFFRAVGGNVVASMGDVGETPEVADLVGGVRVMLEAFNSGRIDQLDIISNEFVNTMTQHPIVKQLLPLPPIDSDEFKHRWDYIYEPDARELVEGLVERYIESLVYQAVVENVACEQAARMIAMKNATDNAEEIVNELTLLYNNARQASITQEISEIVGGAAAV